MSADESYRNYLARIIADHVEAGESVTPLMVKLYTEAKAAVLADRVTRP